jgi:hypothetical protein
VAGNKSRPLPGKLCTAIAMAMVIPKCGEDMYLRHAHIRTSARVTQGTIADTSNCLVPVLLLVAAGQVLCSHAQHVSMLTAKFYSVQLLQASQRAHAFAAGKRTAVSRVLHTP